MKIFMFTVFIVVLLYLQPLHGYTARQNKNQSFVSLFKSQHDFTANVTSSTVQSFVNSFQALKTDYHRIIEDSIEKVTTMTSELSTAINDSMCVFFHKCKHTVIKTAIAATNTLAIDTQLISKEAENAFNEILSAITTLTSNFVKGVNSLVRGSKSNNKLRYAMIAPHTIVSAFYFNMDVTAIVKVHTVNGTFTLPPHAQDCNALFGNPRKGDYKPITVVWVSCDGCVKSQAFMQDVVDVKRNFVLW